MRIVDLEKIKNPYNGPEHTVFRYDTFEVHRKYFKDNSTELTTDLTPEQVKYLVGNLDEFVYLYDNYRESRTVGDKHMHFKSPTEYLKEMEI
jgi:hypothetical protein